VTAPDDLLALNQAPSQADRARAAPSPGRVEVDGRSLSTLLAFAADYGKLIRFYDLTDTPDGDWSVFFEADPSIALALSASLDLASIQADFDQVIATLREADSAATRIERARLAARAIQRLARILTLGQTGGGTFDQLLTDLIGAERRDLLAGPARRLRLLLGGHVPEQAPGLHHRDWLEEFVEHLDAIATALLTALDQAREATLAALDASFDDRNHPPQSGLYDAFARLFDHAQASINRFPARLIDFYQREVLRQTSRSGTPDTLCLTFTLTKGETHVELPRGTRFLAGSDGDGESIAYALETALSVDIASVAALRTLRLTGETIEQGKPPIPAQVLSGVVALSDKAPAIASSFPLFGATETGVSGVLSTVAASLGFAVASPTLMLAGGTRSITIGLTLTDDSLTKMWDICEAIGTAAGGVAAGTVFTTLIEAAFALRYSTAGGWVEIEGGYAVTPVTDSYGLFVLTFVLDSDAGPFVALGTAPADGVIPALDLPVLVAELLQEPVRLSVDPNDPSSGVTVYPYAVLSGMALSALSIDVEVVGLADLEASTPGGAVDTSQPFLLFGSPPVQGASLDIAAPELFAKRMTSFEMEIGWFGLPVTTTGFQGYYRAYVVDADGRTVPPGSQYDNQSFLAGLTVLNPGWWLIATDAPPHYLFQTTANDPTPAPDGQLLLETQLVASVASDTPQAYYDPTLSAVRLTLAQPDTAFGNILYAPNVMAASVQLTAAASACAQQCGQSDANEAPGDPFRPIRVAVAKVPDGGFDQSVRAAVSQTVASLDGAALQAIDAAIATSETADDLRDSLSVALGGDRGWLRKLWGTAPDAATVHANLDAWLAEHGAAIAAPLGKARALIDAGSGVLAIQATAAGRPATVARSIVRAGLQDVQARLADAAGSDTSDCIQQCMQGANLLGFPNQPWLPTAASITVNYTASAALPAAAPSDEAAEAPSAVFYHLLPFNGVAVVPWRTASVPLLVAIDQTGALFIDLSDPAEQLTMLFRLAPPAGGWPTETPQIAWAEATGKAGWTELTPLRDTTDDLRNSGIVSLTITEGDADTASTLRVGTTGDPAVFPDLAGLVTNAAMASWVGPGGGSDLGIPLRAGTVTKPEVQLPGIGSIEQPMPSSGGAPAASGPGFEMWLAERLRHKDRGIQGWDYAHLVLAAFPSLWQVAVVPASNGGVALVPGSVWIVPIPGRETPAIEDPTIPSSDSAMLADIHGFLSSRISPFVDLAVTNPTYLRLKVVADLIFTDEDTLEANKERLNAELIQYLSPWPAPVLGARPDDYYTLNEVAHFVRNRPYVRAILSIALVPEEPAEQNGWHYLTSAISHCLTGKTQSSAEPALPRVGNGARRVGA
jgi:hypothetical protein